MSKEKDARLRALIPTVKDAKVQPILNDPRLLLYTDEEIPQAYQDWDGALQGVHWIHYNISADRREPHGNANIEFPWGTPGGTHRSTGVSSFRFIWLPTDKEGKTLPIAWHKKLFPGDNHFGYAWTFPVGAVVGEVLLLKGPKGEEHAFEIRIRVREYADWAVDVFRPFPTASRLAERIKQLRPNWAENEQLAAVINHLAQPVELKTLTLADEHPVVAFKQSAGVDNLPPLGDDELVEQLLTSTEFVSANGQAWRTGSNGAHTSAPTTEAEFHVVPANYDAGFVAVNRFSCVRCHDSVGKHARDFHFGRDWYGRVRGSDGIFSFHPFSLGTISYNGAGNGVAMREELLEAGFVAKYDPEEHPEEFYNQVPHFTPKSDEGGAAAATPVSSGRPRLLRFLRR